VVYEGLLGVVSPSEDDDDSEQKVVVLWGITSVGIRTARSCFDEVGERVVEKERAFSRRLALKT